MNPALVAVALLGLLALGSKKSSSGTPTAVDTSKVPSGSEGRADLPTVLAPGYTLGNLVVSDTHPDLAAKIVVSADQLNRLTLLAAIVSQLAALVGNALRKPTHLRVSSGLRDADLNGAIGGEIDSQHIMGEAADILPPSGMTSADLARLVIAAGLPFDQMIAYTPAKGGHLHLSYTTRKTNRREVAVINKTGFHTNADPEKALSHWSIAA